MVTCVFVILFQFIDLCILLGCDYCESIRGIGPKRAMDLIKQHKSIEEILKHLDAKVIFEILYLLHLISLKFT